MKPRPRLKTNRLRSSATFLAAALALSGACGDDAHPGPGGTGGAGTACSPGATRACYPGPPKTQNVGVCKAGVETCKKDGSGFGPCEGAVTPQEENCATPVDDDCDGKANEPGAGCVCTPGQIQACYSGPTQTAGVGQCKAGTRSCDASGKAWRGCEGEVTPAPENCNNTIDEDCDGVACSAPLWAALYGDGKGQVGTSVAVDSTGNVFVAGTFSGAINLGGSTLVSAGDDDVFIAKFDPSGTHLWSKQFGGLAKDSASAVAVTPEGELIVVGTFSLTASFGTTTLTSADGIDGFVLMLGSTGDLVWSQRIGDGGNQTVHSVAVGPGDSVVVAGYFTGKMLCSGGPVPICGATSAGLNDIFVRKYDAMGRFQWNQRFGDASEQDAYAVAIDPSGDVYVTGEYQGTLAIGSTQVTNGGLAPNLFVAKLDPLGNGLWLQDYGDTARQTGNAIAIGAHGAVLVAGTYGGTMSFGSAGVLSSPDNALTAFAAALTSDGLPIWARSFGGAANQLANAIAADQDGNVLIAGAAQGSIDLGGGAQTSGGGYDMFLVKLDPEAKYFWGKLLGAAGDQKASAIAVSPTGRIAVVGSADGTIDFGLGALNANGTDAFAASFSP